MNSYKNNFASRWEEEELPPSIFNDKNITVRLANRRNVTRGSDRNGKYVELIIKEIKQGLNTLNQKPKNPNLPSFRSLRDLYAKYVRFCKHYGIHQNITITWDQKSTKQDIPQNTNQNISSELKNNISNNKPQQINLDEFDYNETNVSYPMPKSIDNSGSGTANLPKSFNNSNNSGTIMFPGATIHIGSPDDFEKLQKVVSTPQPQKSKFADMSLEDIHKEIERLKAIEQLKKLMALQQPSQQQAPPYQN